MTADTGAPDKPFTILTVCTGNICRSPLAEQLLRRRLEEAGHPAVRVVSAGTMAEDGAAMETESAELSVRYGGDPTEHRARYLTEAIVADADLVLTASREHRAAVVSLHPRANRYAFTLVEFARLLGEVDEADPTERRGWKSAGDVVASAASVRGMGARLQDASLDDIADPYRRSMARHEETAAQISAAVDTVVAALCPAGRA